MNIEKDLGIQSYCYRGFKDNAKVAELLKQAGVNVLELCAVHVDFNDENRCADVLKIYQNAGVRIAAIGVERFANQEAAERKRFEFAKRAGAKVISADFDLDTVPHCYRTAEKLADEYDINVAIHNHGGQHWLGCARMLRHVFQNTSTRIGLCLDTAWALDSRENPVAMAEQFGKRLYGVHIKDFVFDRARKPSDVVVGEGNLDLAKLMATLKKVNFNGSLIIEYEGDVNDPVPALKKCVAAVKAAAMSSLRA